MARRDMTLLIETPDTRAAERDYILGVILGKFMGVDWQRLSVVGRHDTRITLPSHAAELRIPDIFLQTSDKDWLTFQSLPTQPLSIWDSSELGVPVNNIIYEKLPIIFGDLSYSSPIDHHSISITLPLDIFGSAFFMLTRYEEIVKSYRDSHDRFPAYASLAYQEEFLERPIIDEYVEVFWTVLKNIWPLMKRKNRKFRVKVSHDVDRPSRYRFGSPQKFLQAIAGDIIKRADVASAISAPRCRWMNKEQLHPSDPVNTFDWIMDISERYGLISEFFFLSGRTHKRRDADYDLVHPAIRHLIRRIYLRGHKIGIHLSYNTYKQPRLMSKEMERLRNICKEEQIHQREFNSRMHYLRWQTPVTARGLESSAIANDFSLGFADRPGFRAGTCHKYPFFDSIALRELNLIINPLILMEGSMFSKKYMALENADEMIALIAKLKNNCKRVKGTFVLLWHNTELLSPTKRHIYNRALTI